MPTQEMLSKKRTLEGNIDLSNSFSILDNDELLVQKCISMGVKLDDNNFVAINLLKDLEYARIALNQKKKTCHCSYL